MRKYNNKIKIFSIVFCAGVVLLSTILPAEQLAYGISNIMNNETSNTIIVPDDYPTISQALSHVMDGDIIFVKAGVYKENLVINKMVTLEGEAYEHVIIDGDQKGDVIKIAASGVTIKGFTIMNSDVSCAGIDINMSHYHTITMNIIQSNYYGIKMYSSNGNNISYNIITDNLYHGISSEACHYNIINDNEMNENGLSGLYIHFTSTFNEAKYNIINSNGLNTGASFYDESLAGGVVLDTACRSNSVVSNDIESNQIGANSEGANENNILYYNNFIDNVESNAKDTTKNDWNKKGESIGNYWSDYTGIDADGDGIGDTPYPIEGGDNEDVYPLMDSSNPQEPIIEGPTKHDKKAGEVKFKFYALENNYPQVYFEINWGDKTPIEIKGPLNPLTGITISHNYETELQYTIKVRIKVILQNGDTLKSIWSRHKITISKTKQLLEEKNVNRLLNDFKPLLFPEILVRFLEFFYKTSISQKIEPFENLHFSRQPKELSLTISHNFYDRVLEKQLFLKNLFFILKR